MWGIDSNDRQQEAEALREGSADLDPGGLKDEIKFILIVGVGIALALGWALANAFILDGPGFLNYGGVALGSGAAVLLLRRWDLHWDTRRVVGPITIGLVVLITGFNALIVDTGGLSQVEVDLFNRAAESFERGDYRAAVADLTEVIESNPPDPQLALACVNRGFSYLGLGQYERATADYDRAIELDPNDAVAFNNRGVSYNELGEFERAIADYDRAIMLDPNDADFHQQPGGFLCRPGPV